MQSLWQCTAWPYLHGRLFHLFAQLAAHELPLPLSKEHSLPNWPLAHKAVSSLLHVQWVGAPCGVAWPPCAHDTLIYCTCVSGRSWFLMKCYAAPAQAQCSAVICMCASTVIVFRHLSTPSFLIYGTDCRLCAAWNSFLHMGAV